MVDAPSPAEGPVSDQTSGTNALPPGWVGVKCSRCRTVADVLTPSGFRLEQARGRATLQWGDAADYVCYPCHIAAADGVPALALQHDYAVFGERRRQLGVPPGVTMHHFQSPGRPDLPRLRGLRAELFAVRVVGFPEDSPVPSFRIVPDGGQTAVQFVFPLIVVQLAGVPAGLERRWDIATGRLSLEIVGWEDVPRLRDLQRLMAGVEFLRQFEHAGRAPGTTSVPADEFAARLPAEYAELRRRFGRRPRQEDLAEAFSVSVPTFKRYIAEYRAAGNPWPPQTDY